MSEAIALLQSLNPEQQKAVQHHEGAILVIAGAGSGKTRVLTHRVAHLIMQHSVRPSSILAVTFTNKATQEMQERLESLLGDAAKRVWIATFHSMALRILRRHADKLGYGKNFAVYDDKDSKQVIKRILAEMDLDPKRYPVSRFARVIDKAKNAFISPEQYAKNNSGFDSSINAEVYDRYQKELKSSDAMDFGDLLVQALILLREHKEVLALYQDMLNFVLVDEFQDTNKIQYEIIQLLSWPQNNILVVGDDDQSIYAFRGATIANILNFEKDYPDATLVKLEQNYRSTQSILEVAHSVIAKNTSRKPKKLWTDAAAGSPIFTFVGDDESAEAAFIARQIIDLKGNGVAYKDMALFYRTNAQSRALEEALMDRQIPYRIFGGLKFYDRKEVKDVLAYLRMLVSDKDNQAFIRTLNNPSRGIGAKTLQGIIEIARANSTSLWLAACKYSETNKAVKVYVDLIKQLRQRLAIIPLGQLIATILADSAYLKRLGDEKDPAVLSRKENLKELQSIAITMEGVESNTAAVLQQFLDRVTLSSSADIPGEISEEERQAGVVSLMTLHLAKGLEFSHVFFTGLEQGLCPHSRSMEDIEGMEEERRLCYVGITRAMKRLYLTRARQRGMFSAGSAFGVGGRFREPSCFMYDIPASYLESLGGDFLSTFSVSEDFEPIDDFADFNTWKQTNKAKKKTRSLEENSSG